jgi:hypothetical protein
MILVLRKAPTYDSIRNLQIPLNCWCLALDCAVGGTAVVEISYIRSQTHWTRSSNFMIVLPKTNREFKSKIRSLSCSSQSKMDPVNTLWHRYPSLSAASTSVFHDHFPHHNQ